MFQLLRRKGARMIDTVRVQTSVWASLEVPEGWDSSSGTVIRYDGRRKTNVESEWIAFQHVETGLRVYGNPVDEFSWAGVKVECSLPRMIHPHNGILIKDQRELDEAQARMWSLVQSLCLPGREAFTGEQIFSRVDLVWQFRGVCGHWIQDLSKAYHPRIRKSKVIYEGESIHFPGRHRHLRVYDKSKESLGRAGDVVRVELQLTGDPLKWAFTGKRDICEPVKSLNFSQAYWAYRDFLYQFEPVKNPDLGSMPQFLGYVVRHDIRGHDGQSLFDLWARGKHPKSVRRVLRQIQRSDQAWTEFSLRKLLPFSGPPEAVDLEAEGVPELERVG